MRRTGGVARVRFDGNDIIDFQVTSMVDEGSLVAFRYFGALDRP
jgi:hypothetical protein